MPNPCSTTRSTTYAHQRGATLIEVLITMFIVALSLLGTIGLQLAATRYQQTSSMRTKALEQAEFILEKMRANSSQLTSASNLYKKEEAYSDATPPATVTTCGTTTTECDANAAAEMDLAEWRINVARTLPGGRGSIYGVSTDPVARRIVVMWNEKTQSQTDSDANLKGNGAAFTDPSCPAPQVEYVRCFNIWVTP